jgi:hypothetical protein
MYGAGSAPVWWLGLRVVLKPFATGDLRQGCRRDLAEPIPDGVFLNEALHRTLRHTLRCSLGGQTWKALIHWHG